MDENTYLFTLMKIKSLMPAVFNEAVARGKNPEYVQSACIRLIDELNKLEHDIDDSDFDQFRLKKVLR